MKRISILGSTGSIGRQTLDVASRHPDRIKITALAAGCNAELLEEQIRRFSPSLAALYDEQAAEDLRARTSDLSVRIVSGMEGLIEAAAGSGAELVVTALVGMIGIRPTIEAILAGCDIALANKESMVTAGHLICPLAKEKGVRILPVDSEHSAIFQCLQGEKEASVRELLLTASGGPFRSRKREELRKVRPEDALRHPNWNMGQKITIDSATLVNKGLEVIEASRLFQVPPERIRVVVHPQSIVHSMVSFCDGAIIAQLGAPDMRLPIQYALFYPEARLPLLEPVDLASLQTLTFEEPDTETFPGLALGIRAIREGGSMTTVYNAANEEAVDAFLDGKIGFLDICESIETAMDHHEGNKVESPDLETILQIESDTRALVRGRW